MNLIIWKLCSIFRSRCKPRCRDPPSVRTELTKRLVLVTYDIFESFNEGQWNEYFGWIQSERDKTVLRHRSEELRRPVLGPLKPREIRLVYVQKAPPPKPSSPLANSTNTHLKPLSHDLRQPRFTGPRRGKKPTQRRLLPYLLKTRAIRYAGLD